MFAEVKKKGGRPPRTEQEKRLAQAELESRKELAVSLFAEIRSQAGDVTESELAERLGLERNAMRKAVQGYRALTFDATMSILDNYIRNFNVPPAKLFRTVRIPLEFSLEQQMQIEARTYEVQSEIRALESERKLAILRSELKNIESQIREAEKAAFEEEVFAIEKILQKLSSLYYQKTGNVLGVPVVDEGKDRIDTEK